jgi:hypothetical protein
VKQDDGGKKEALAQLSIWLSASLEKMRMLGGLSRSDSYPNATLQPIVGWTVIGHDWHSYIAYKSKHNEGDDDDAVVSLTVTNS